MNSNYRLPVMYKRIARWTNGSTPLPERYVIGKICQNHVVNGKTVRYTKGKECVLCLKAYRIKSHNRPDESDLTNKRALDAYEDRLNAEEYDPLFDGEIH